MQKSAAAGGFEACDEDRQQFMGFSEERIQALGVDDSLGMEQLKPIVRLREFLVAIAELSDELRFAPRTSCFPVVRPNRSS